MQKLETPRAAPDVRPEVWVADDDAEIREFLAVALELAGLRARLFASGEELLAAYDPALCAAVIVDLQMPDMNGLEVLRRLRDVSRDCPVVLVSGNANGDTIQRAKKLGLAAFFPKPFNVRALIDHVGELVRAAAGKR